MHSIKGPICIYKSHYQDFKDICHFPDEAVLDVGGGEGAVVTWAPAEIL